MPEVESRSRRARLAWSAVVLVPLAVAAVLGPLLAQGREEVSAGPSAERSARQAAAATAARLAESGLLDVPVRFTVANRNESLLPCTSDGEEYLLEGHLTGPAGLLAGPEPEVDLYQHGQSGGEWAWRLDEPGLHHTEEMARLGRVSVTVERLGYGEGEQPPGLAVCLGSQADMTSQVIEQLRSGSYAIETVPGGPERAPAFSRVSLIGHQSGAQIAEIAAYSSPGPGGPDALVLLGWAGAGASDAAMARFFGGLAACMQGGVPAGAAGAQSGAPEPGGAEAEPAPAGYVYVEPGRAVFTEANFHAPDSVAAGLAAQSQERTPCGELGSQIEAQAVGSRHLPRITVPVLAAYGERDEQIDDAEGHLRSFTGSVRTDSIVVPEAGGYLMLEAGAPQFRERLAEWLEARA